MIPSKVYQLALLGFSDFERQTLGSFFRLGAATGPAYALTAHSDAADFLLADADHLPSVQLVQATERAAITIFIGANPPDEAMSWMSRPIDPLRVLRELEAMVGLSTSAAAPGGRAGPVHADPPAALQPTSVPGLLDTWQPETQPGWEPEWPPGWEPEAAAGPAPGREAEPAPLTAATPAPEQARARASAEAPDLELDLDLEPRAAAAVVATVAPSAAAAPAPPAAAAAAAVPPAAAAPAPARRSRSRTAAPQRLPLPQTALVVDDSEIAARFLLRRLALWGLRVDCASTSRQALALLDSRTYDLVFVDVELGPASELDGLALCQRIKQSAATVGANVIVVSAHHGELDRARGALAGCDAYLGKPLAEAELAPLLLRRGLVKSLPAVDAS